MDTGPRPLVSVVIPAFNRAGLLPDTLRALASQPYRPLEVIVVDDGSTDGTPEQARVWMSRAAADGLTVRLQEQQRRGAAAARNAGWALAGGRYLHFLDSDDVPGPHFYETLVTALEAHPACAFAWGDWVSAEEAAAAAAALPPPAATAARPDDAPPNNAWCGLYRAAALPAGLRWNEQLVNHNDWDFTTRFLMAGPDLLRVPGALLAYRTHRGPERLGRVHSPDTLQQVLAAAGALDGRLDPHARYHRTLRQRLSYEYTILLYQALEAHAPAQVRLAAAGVRRHATRHQNRYWLCVGAVLLLTRPFAGTRLGRIVLRRVRRSFGDMQLTNR